MKDSAVSARFLDALICCLDNIGPSVKVCRRAQQEHNGPVKVLAAAILQVLREIQDYLSYYEEYIEKGFGEPVAAEEKRVQSAVLCHFRARLAALSTGEGDSGPLLSEVIEAVADLVERWNSFDRADVDRILGSGRAPEAP